jgi:hypothetical protein
LGAYWGYDGDMKKQQYGIHSGNQPCLAGKSTIYIVRCSHVQF